jgi:hypothetical protein
VLILKIIRPPPSTLMATLVRQLITPILKNPFAWRVLDGTFLRLARKMDQWRRAEIGDGSPLDASICGRFLNRMVRHGLFYGMKYPSFEAAGRTLYPKLLGSYERELHGIMDRIVRTDYATVVEIGCAEGYYATGLALRLPEARVIAFDSNPQSRELCRQLAEANGVSSRVEVYGHCTPETLLRLPLGRRALLLFDCGGDEPHMFAPDCIAMLAAHDLLIELHLDVNSDIPEILQRRFAATHHIESVASTADAEKPAHYPWTAHENFSPAEWRALLAEGRTGTVEWLWLTSKHAGV